MTDDNEVRYRYQRKRNGHRDGDTGIDASRALSEIPPPHVEVHRCMHVSLRNGIAHAILRETEGRAGADAGISEVQVQR